MADINTTLHPEGAPEDNLYPNVKDANIPSSIARKSDLAFKKETLYTRRLTLTSSFAYIANSNFTISKPSIVEVIIGYNNVAPMQISVGSTEQTTNPALHGMVISNDYNPGALFFTVFLSPGTYGVWARASGNNADDVTVNAWTIE